MAAPLRIFDVGHAFEDLSIALAASAGFDLRTRDRWRRAVRLLHRRRSDARAHRRRDRRRARGRHRVAGAVRAQGPQRRRWTDVREARPQAAKPIYFAQVQLYMAYMEVERRCSPHSTRTPRRSTTSSCRSTSPPPSASPRRGADRARRGVDGRRGDGARSAGLRQADPGAGRPRPAAADQGRGRVHPGRARRDADRDPPPGRRERDHPPRHHGPRRAGRSLTASTTRTSGRCRARASTRSRCCAAAR